MQPNPALFTLQIAELQCGRGMIGLTFCPGLNPDDAHTRNRGGPHSKPRTTPHLSARIRERSMAGGVGWLCRQVPQVQAVPTSRENSLIRATKQRMPAFPHATGKQ